MAGDSVTGEKKLCRASVEKVYGKKFLMADPTCSFEFGHEGDHSWSKFARELWGEPIAERMKR